MQHIVPIISCFCYFYPSHLHSTPFESFEAPNQTNARHGTYNKNRNNFFFKLTLSWFFANHTDQPHDKFQKNAFIKLCISLAIGLHISLYLLDPND